MGQQMWGGKRDYVYLGKKLALPGLIPSDNNIKLFHTCYMPDTRVDDL